MNDENYKIYCSYLYNKKANLQYPTNMILSNLENNLN